MASGRLISGRDGMPPLIEGDAVMFTIYELLSRAVPPTKEILVRPTAICKGGSRLVRAPIAFSADSDRYIRGGTETDQYDNIGALRLRGGPHCTATVIGTSKLFDGSTLSPRLRVSELDFVVGKNVSQPDIRAVSGGVGGLAPRTRSTGYHYQSGTLEDDIGIVLLDMGSALPMQPAIISSDGRPTMVKCWNKNDNCYLLARVYLRR